MNMILCRASEKNSTIWRFPETTSHQNHSYFKSMYSIQPPSDIYIKYIYKSSQMFLGALLGGPEGFHHPWDTDKTNQATGVLENMSTLVPRVGGKSPEEMRALGFGPRKRCNR